MRVAVLWNRLHGYLNACLRELAAIPESAVFVSRRCAGGESPLEDHLYGWIENQCVYQNNPDLHELRAALEKFAPDMLVVASWNRPEYRAICREYRGRALRVCCMDNQWHGTAKQWLGVVTAHCYVRRLFDATLVAGERQAQFARKFGFDQSRIWAGFLSCDHPAFHRIYELNEKGSAERKSFIFVGRLAPEKALDVLMEAYRLYRSRVADPWHLLVAGEGPLRDQMKREPGVVWEGFVQPRDLPEVLGKAGCLVMPSRFEPWGVAIHEATAAGLPVICTSPCGASVHLVQDGFNGYVVAADNVEVLAHALEKMASLPTDRLREMSAGSAALSAQFTPRRWASSLCDHYRDARETRSAPALNEARKRTHA